MRDSLSPNPNLQVLIAELKALYRKEKVPLWHRIAEEMSRPSRQRRSVNIDTIQSACNDGEIALVPGKVLSNGELTKKVTVAAFQFSQSAKDKLKNTITIKELMAKNPKGKGVRIVG